MQYQILGDDIQYVKVFLNPGEKIYAEAGHLMSKSSTVAIQAKMRGGILSAIKRELTGATFFVTELVGPGEVDIAGVFPGKIVPIELNGRGLLAESHSFLFAEDTVNYDAKLAPLAPAILGGEGLFLATFNGVGKIFLHAYGGLYEVSLMPGQSIDIEASHLLALEEGVQFTVSRVGGFKTMLFGGEGLYFVKVTGPGKVWVHSITAQQMASALAPFLPGGQKGGLPF
ncbi:TIGR00266 family protein [Acidianus sp. HS-5]|uniref:TIGR00266 family protein n=1 Tax=Acidianus sp. HS-5 TaxID=2886040 RepID=UPI001F22AF9A|nr:TIGR00266 family protein [Acidianus sp. HS-5]BDC18941.1 transcriptional regulator [Acidianus sp. HS-5]